MEKQREYISNETLYNLVIMLFNLVQKLYIDNETLLSIMSENEEKLFGSQIFQDIIKEENIVLSKTAETFKDVINDHDSIKEIYDAIIKPYDIVLSEDTRKIIKEIIERKRQWI